MVLYSVALGVVLEVIFGAIGQAATGGKRDLSSVAQTQAERYDVQVDVELADRAITLPHEMQPTSPAA